MPFIRKSELLLTHRDDAHADVTLSNIRHNFNRCSVGKSTRPWFYLNLAAAFPSDTTLIGFEVETGVMTNEERDAVTTWLWDNTEHTTIDPEGTGSIFMEITFPPEDITRIGEGQFAQFIAYAQTSPLIQRRVSSNGSYGMHANISTPAWRAAAPEARTIAAQLIRAAMAHIPNDCRFHLEGRSPYTTAAGNSISETAGTERMEFKMFHVSFHPEQVRNYTKVAQRLAEMMDAVLRGERYTGASLFNFLTQDLPRRSVIAEGNTAQYTVAQRRGYDESYSPPAQQ